MTRYFRLRDDLEARGRWHLSEIVSATDHTEPVFDSGEVTNELDDLVATVSHPGRVLDFTLTSFNTPVATTVLARAIKEAAGPDVQCLPVRVAGQPGLTVLNAVRLVRCLDETRSELTKWTKADHRADLAGQYRQVTRLALDAARIPLDAHFFRVSDWTVALIVSEQVKETMERAGCVGARFTDVTGPK